MDQLLGSDIEEDMEDEFLGSDSDLTGTTSPRRADLETDTDSDTELDIDASDAKPEVNDAASPRRAKTRCPTGSPASSPLSSPVRKAPAATVPKAPAATVPHAAMLQAPKRKRRLPPSADTVDLIDEEWHMPLRQKRLDMDNDTVTPRITRDQAARYATPVEQVQSSMQIMCDRIEQCLNGGEWTEEAQAMLQTVRSGVADMVPGWGYREPIGNILECSSREALRLGEARYGTGNAARTAPAPL
jgi:hypothetical protein